MNQPLLNALDFAATLGLGALLLLLSCAFAFAIRGALAVRRARTVTVDVPSDPATWWGRKAKAMANELELSE